MNNKLLMGLVVLAAGVLVGWYMFGGDASLTSQTMRTDTEESVVPTIRTEASLEEQASGTGQMVDKGGVVSRIVVTYTDTGFAPVTVTVKAGTTVTFVNESTGSMWVASAVHPTHQLLPGFDQKASVVSDGTYEYAFTKVGTWKYHNHMNPSQEATVVVTQ